MQTIETIRDLLDEMPVLSEISKNLPFPYNVVIEQKIKEFNAYLSDAHTNELERQEKKKRTKNNSTGSQLRHLFSILLYGKDK